MKQIESELRQYANSLPPNLWEPKAKLLEAVREIEYERHYKNGYGLFALLFCALAIIAISEIWR